MCWGQPAGRQLCGKGRGGLGGHQVEHKPAFIQRKLVVSWAALSKSVASRSRRRWSFPSPQHLWDHRWTAVSNSGLPSTREAWARWRVQHRAPQIPEGLEHLSREKGLRAETVQPWLRADLISLYKYSKGQHPAQLSKCCTWPFCSYHVFSIYSTRTVSGAISVDGPYIWVVLGSCREEKRIWWLLECQWCGNWPAKSEET